MNKHKLILSITLGALLTIGLLAGFSLSRNMITASAEAPEVIEQATPAEAIRAQDAVSAAHVVVVFSGEKAAVRSITWTGTISRVKALERAGFDVGHMGDTICHIEGDGCPTTDCFCPDNWWWQGVWDAGLDAWNAPWPLPNPTDEDVLGFRNNTAWGPPIFPAQSYVGSQKALDWLQDQQQADGGFGSANNTADVLMAVGANGMDAASWRQGPSLLANMLSTGAELANKNAAGVGKLAVGLVAQDSCWPIGAKRPISYYDPISGTFDDDTLYQAWGILGTAALSETVPVSAVESLKEAQLPNGGWEWAVGMGADTNDTAMALQALIAAGEPVTSTSVVSGLKYLENAQNDDGGFPYSPDSPWGTDSDANSTAYVVQALLATGEDPITGTWAVTTSNPISYLLSMQLPDGSFEWQKGYGADQMATQQAIPALLHQAYPLKVNNLNACYGISGLVIDTEVVANSINAQSADMHLSGVSIRAQGNDDVYFGTTISPSNHYTLSVPSTGVYTLTPFHSNYVLSPTEQSVEVSGSPGSIASASEIEADPAADLSVNKFDSIDPVNAGSLLTYTVTVRNTGLITAENVIITDILPSEVVSPSAGTVILPQPPGTIVMPDSKVWWKFGAIEPGEVQTLTLRVKVQPWVSNAFTNTVQVTTSSPESDLGDNRADEVTKVTSYIYLPLVMRNSS